MKTKVPLTTTVSKRKLLKDNKRLCLSAKRALNRCFTCKLYWACESKIPNPEYEALYRKRKELYAATKVITEEIKNL